VLVEIEGSFRLVFIMVPSTQVHVLPAARGEDELQGEVHRIQE